MILPICWDPEPLPYLLPLIPPALSDFNELLAKILKNKQRMEENFKENPCEYVDVVTAKKTDVDVQILQKFYYKEDEHWTEETTKFSLLKSALPDEISKILEESKPDEEADITDFIESIIPPFLLEYNLDEVAEVSFANWRQIVHKIYTLEKQTPKKYLTNEGKVFYFKTKFFAEKVHNSVKILRKFYFEPQISYTKNGEKIFPQIFLEKNIVSLPCEKIPAEFRTMLDGIKSNTLVDVTEFIEIELDNFKKI